MNRTAHNGHPYRHDVDAEPPEAPRWLTAWELIDSHPSLRPIVVDGHLREGEVGTLISGSKSRKTWHLLNLAVSTTAGQMWLGRYQTAQGNVLYIDNELHEESLAFRLPQVAEALGVSPDVYGPRLCIQSLRGRLMDVDQLDPLMRTIERGMFKLIILDALYRFWPAGLDENSNADIAQILNRIDQYAKITGAAFLLVHHSTKGNQAGKGIMDVGAGGGALGRGVDWHSVLRPHEEADCCVMESEVRSFPKPAPIGLRWNFPLWRYDSFLDPTKLRRPGKGGAEDAEQPEPEWTAERFAAEFYSDRGRTRDEIIVKAKAAGLSMKLANLLHGAAVASGNVHRWYYGPKSKEQFATVTQPLVPSALPAPARKPRTRKGKA